MNKNKSLAWFKEQDNIIIEEEWEDRILDIGNPLIGVYGFFVEEESKEECVYIGRAVNIYKRLFSNGHITKLMKNKHNKRLSEAMEERKMITIKVLKEVEFEYENYAKDMHELAFVEYEQIRKYQKKGECFEQLPDGSNMERKVWDAKCNQIKR